ncbi:uncharacterized protein BJ171DRAFT_567232 [Polychytrium aggregatum]|uniref:uncharacterized protein n=1 Tax=Polychytrium aggregatum TaxID=110093 RepID=UPI0022FDFBDD|nr:uncharacterized protein BJ171DRAFT_567232 [Polychytrium aggregatum]KAI9205945.1 hypothetical protein BJ171DRAFT_567232 [Polychytrium aggregatum]
MQALPEDSTALAASVPLPRTPTSPSHPFCDDAALSSPGNPGQPLANNAESGPIDDAAHSRPNNSATIPLGTPEPAPSHSQPPPGPVFEGNLNAKELPKPPAPEPGMQPPDDSAETEYHLKPIRWFSVLTGNPKPLRIITQNRNGPCPLLALSNVLLLRGAIKIHPDLPSITYQHLVDLIGDYMLTRMAANEQNLRLSNLPEDLANFSHNLQDVMNTIPLLQRGLDVNVKFDSPYSFELTPALLLFDIFGVSLCHGWTISSSDSTFYDIVVRELGCYNKVVEKVIEADIASTNPLLAQDPKLQEIAHKGFVCQQFLEMSASQLTPHGLRLLQETLPSNSISVLFRNNHFYTLYKDDRSQLFTLVTDQGFLRTEGVVWESLASVDGDSIFLDDQFRPYQEISQSSIDQERLFDYGESNWEHGPATTTHDSDLALALRLQEEERVQAEAIRLRNQQIQASMHMQPGDQHYEQYPGYASNQQEQTNQGRLHPEQRPKRQDSQGDSKCMIM